MKKIVGAVSAALLVLALHAPAQGLDLRVGGNLNWGTANDFGIGPRIEVDLKEYFPGLRLAGDYHRFFDSQVYSDVDGRVVEANSWDVGVHVLYDVARVSVAEGATIYAGIGVMYAKRNYDHWLGAAAEDISDDELRNRYSKLQALEADYDGASGVSVPLTVGSTFTTGWTVIPYVEARYTIGIVDELLLAAGILFSTGSGTE